MTSGVYKRTKEIKDQISKTLTGRKLTPEHRKNIGLNGFHYGMLGKKHSQNTRLKMSLSRQNEKHPLWKGDKVGYIWLHQWVRRKLGKANYCKHCGLDKKKPNKKRCFEWANISKKYKRDLNDWISLCMKCHKKFDK